MNKLGFDLDNGSEQATAGQVNPQEASKNTIQRCIQSLIHACQCRDTNCRLQSCARMKRVVQHTKNCKTKANENCPVCKQLMALCFYHAKHCTDTICAVPMCSSIKQKLETRQMQHRVQQQQLMQSRMALMNSRINGSSSQSTANALLPGGNCSGAQSSSSSTTPTDHTQQSTPHISLGMGMKPTSAMTNPNIMNAVEQEARKNTIQRCIQSLKHAGQCRDTNCRLQSCVRMKRVIHHTKNCKTKANGNCPVCKHLIALCFYHAKHCRDTICTVPICSSIKQKLGTHQMQHRVQQQQLMRRLNSRVNGSSSKCSIYMVD